MTTEPPDRSGAVIHPPVLYGGALALGLIGEYLLPSPGLAVVPVAARAWVGWGLFGASFVVVAAAVLRFLRAGTNIPVNRPTIALVTDGLYRFSRNPIYVALTTSYLGIAIAADSLWTAALVVPVLVVMRVGVIAREEAYLARKFPDAYPAYKARVRRWL